MKLITLLYNNTIKEGKKETTKKTGAEKRKMGKGPVFITSVYSDRGQRAKDQTGNGGYGGREDESAIK